MIYLINNFLSSVFSESHLKQNTYRLRMKRCIKSLVLSHVSSDGNNISLDELFELTSITFSKQKCYVWCLEEIHDTLSFITYPEPYSEDLIDIFVTILPHASQSSNNSL